MSDKAPSCQILIPAPWQSFRTQGVSEFERDVVTEELSVEELCNLIWTIVEMPTHVPSPSYEDVSRPDTRLPVPRLEEDVNDDGDDNEVF